MQYQITSDNIEMSESMESLTKSKFAKIERRLKNIPEDAKFIRVVLNKAVGTEDKFSVKSEVNIPNKKYFSDETDYKLETALIKVVNEITRMMDKEKEKWVQKDTDLKVRDAKRFEDELAQQEVENFDEEQSEE